MIIKGGWDGMGSLEKQLHENALYAEESKTKSMCNGTRRCPYEN